MADYQQRDNSGVLFKNDKKGKEKAPDYTGNCLVNGAPMQISAWIKEGAKGKFMSLAFSEPFKPNANKPKPETNEQDFEDFREDDIPF